MELTETINEMIDTLKSIEMKLHELCKSLSSMPQISPIVVNTVRKKDRVDNFDFTMKKSKPVEPNKEKPQVKKGRKPKPKVNKFTDDGLDVSKEEVGYDQIQDNTQPTRRNKREPFRLASCRCENCGEQVEMNPVFKRDYFVCDACISKKVTKDG